MEHPGRETRTTTTPETPKARRNKIRIRSEVDRWIQAKDGGGTAAARAAGLSGRATACAESHQGRAGQEQASTQEHRH
ncbi:hypothetical protein BJ997_000859 [Cryobacterium roopkundense]|uniref:Uncharacterized protein n=1 Tax=Cryobacterium roopkundense TaxID=1001240 RepID=A0A7W9E2R0_9MICO|nr:hypothetical protein [Cryobacterium roopkundense]